MHALRCLLGLGLIASVATTAGCGSGDTNDGGASASESDLSSSCAGEIEGSFRSYAALPRGYEAMKAADKSSELWKVVGANGYSPSCRPSSGLFLNALATVNSAPNIAETVNHASDEMPAGRRKMVHPFGTVATFDFIKDPRAPAYTGILAPGQTVHGVMRASLGGDPNVIGFTPGLAVKFLIDGKPSVNVVAMRSLMGQGADRNFLRYELSNELNEVHADIGRDGSFLDWAKADAFAFVQNNIFLPALARGPQPPNPNALHIDHLAVHDATGALVAPDKRRAPARIFFRPSADLAHWWDQPYNAGRDYRDMLSALSEGTELYEVWAKETSSSAQVRIGVLRTTRRFYMSPWGDYRLFFRHNDHQNNADVAR